MKGRFLVIEGIDGSGKSSQLDHLARWLPKSGLMSPEAEVHLTKEPGGTALGVALRDLLLYRPGEVTPSPVAELLLYAADRAQHVSQKIRPALAKGDWVLSDRFSGSTVAYQGYGRNLDIKLIEQLELIATGGLTPDLTLWLELPLAKSIQRRGALTDDRIEAEGVEFLSRVAVGFSELAKQRSWVKIQADNKLEVVSKLIQREVQIHFGLS